MARGHMEAGDKGESPTGSLNCAEVRELFPDYFSGRLSPFQSVLFEEHRAACASCRGELAIRARETMRVRLNSIPARRGDTEAPVGALLHQVLFRPARVKVPLEAAGLLIIIGLGFYLSQRSSPHVTVAERTIAAPAPKAVIVPRVENVPSEATAKVRSDVPTIVEPKPEARHPVKPQAKAAPPAARPRQSPPTAVPQSAVPQQPAETQPSDERLALAEGDTDASNSKESAVPDALPDFSGKDKTGEANPADVTGDSRISPDDLPYFFLYNPSMKPL